MKFEKVTQIALKETAETSTQLWAAVLFTYLEDAANEDPDPFSLPSMSKDALEGDPKAIEKYNEAVIAHRDKLLSYYKDPEAEFNALFRQAQTAYTKELCSIVGMDHGSLLRRMISLRNQVRRSACWSVFTSNRLNIAA